LETPTSLVLSISRILKPNPHGTFEQQKLKMDYGLTLEDVRECMTMTQMTPKGLILIFIELKSMDNGHKT